MSLTKSTIILVIVLISINQILLEKKRTSLAIIAKYKNPDFEIFVSIDLNCQSKIKMNMKVTNREKL